MSKKRQTIIRCDDQMMKTSIEINIDRLQSKAIDQFHIEEENSKVEIDKLKHYRTRQSEQGFREKKKGQEE